MAGSTELAAAFERAVGERLLSAERLVLSLPQLFRELLVECDLAYRASSHLLVAVARLSPRAQGEDVHARLQFWCARAGGVASSLDAMSEPERASFGAEIERCELRARAVSPQMLFEAIERIVTGAGAPADRPRPTHPRPTLVMDASGPGWEGVLYEGATETLFIPGNIAPPAGDEIAVALRVPGAEQPVEVKARVSQVRSPGEAAPGAPAGFTLALQAPPASLTAALAKKKMTRTVDPALRAAPRYPVKAPVRVIARLPAAARALRGEREPAGASPVTARLEYATDQELAADYVANLSQGGAFVRTARPAAVGAQVMLEMRLPGGVELKARSIVVFTNQSGMGVRFELDPSGQETLSGVIARISARPRRALVVDDDPVVRRMLSKTLQARGFEVLTAADGATGLQTVTEELLTLDLLITDLNMPNLDGESFIRTIRQAGGESELTIVVVTASDEPGLQARLEALGADGVLEKTLGPVLIAQAADAVLERKRLASS